MEEFVSLKCDVKVSCDAYHLREFPCLSLHPDLPFRNSLLNTNSVFILASSLGLPKIASISYLPVFKFFWIIWINFRSLYMLLLLQDVKRQWKNLSLTFRDASNFSQTATWRRISHHVLNALFILWPYFHSHFHTVDTTLNLNALPTFSV